MCLASCSGRLARSGVSVCGWGLEIKIPGLLDFRVLKCKTCFQTGLNSLVSPKQRERNFALKL
jgi:hypothetical protein